MSKRNAGTPAENIFVILLIGLASFSVSAYFSHLLFGLFSGLSAFSDPFFREAGRYFCFIPYWIIVPAAIALFRPLSFLPGKALFHSMKQIKPFFAGVFWGFVLSGICILIPFLDRSAVLKPNPSFNPLYLPVLFLCVLIQAGAEELLFRKFFQRSLEISSVPRWAAIIIPALLFSAVHISNSGISFPAMLVLFTSGVIYGLLFQRSGSFSAVAGMHTAWNFSQSIIFGFPDSGVPTEYSLFTANSIRGKTLSYDPSFGIEASLTTFAVLLAVITLLFFSGKPVKRR